MKKLSELYQVDSDVMIKGIKMNSKEIEEGDLFVATQGVVADRHDFIDDAIEKGASAVVVSKDVGVKSVPVIKVENTNQELPKLCAKFYNHPEKELFIIGVTGTNGKTTVAKILYDMIGSDAAYLGSLGAIWKDKRESLINTTPDSDKLFKYFRKMVDDGCKILVMETASEAFYRKRLEEIEFDISILTNVTGDHLNIHKTMDNYIACKSELFMKTKKDGICILNSDDKFYQNMKDCANGKVVTYGKESSDAKIINVELDDEQTYVEIVIDNKKEQFHIPLPGEYNAYNFSACILVLLNLGYSLGEIRQRINNIKTIEGRGEFIDKGQDFKIVLDYAHTPEALRNILEYLNKVKKGKIITVTGSAGGREHEKRPAMGRVVLDMSDYVIFTMDDPRYEDPNDIIDDLLKDSTSTNYERIIDREKAIYKAFDMAEKDDIVLVAGKARDNYMAVEDKYLPYNDYDVILSYFEE